MAAVQSQRRHDLDALRAIAMLLGIALHASLTFIPFAWMVQDRHQNAIFGILNSSIHGFRMQLFFLVSGFFTAMLWRQKGLKSLLTHRFKRLFIPCMLGLVTIIPLLNLTFAWVFASSNRPKVTAENSGPIGELVKGMRNGERSEFEKAFSEVMDANVSDSEFGVTMLAWATMLGNEEAVEYLISKGARLDAPNRDGSTALHGAAFLGRTSILKSLLGHGANPKSKSFNGDQPVDASYADWGTTQFIANLLKLPLGSEEELNANRLECRNHLPARESKIVPNDRKTDSSSGPIQNIRASYAAFVNSERWLVRRGAQPFHLIHTPVFHHLWFLWFLCWFLVPFALIAGLAGRFNIPKAPRHLFLSPVLWLWLIPLTLLPQLLMGTQFPTFGPDTSVGVIPPPHLLLYYGIFFAFGVLYFDCEDFEGRLGRWWWFSLPIALVVLLPIGLQYTSTLQIAPIVQVVYAWLMIFGTIGLFRYLVPNENKFLRYLSDSSYWLYLAHLPLVVALQQWMRYWDIPSGMKFILICGITCALLLITYQWCVRYTPIGTLLNGKKVRSKHGASRSGDGQKTSEQ